MAKTDTMAVVQRLLDDEDVHKRLVRGGTAAREAYLRARKLPARKAVQDKNVYERIREAAGDLTEASRKVLGEPEPPPKRRGVRTVLVLAGTGAVVAWAARRYEQGQQPPT